MEPIGFDEITTKEQLHFFNFAARLTGHAIDTIKMVWCETDPETDLMDGCIEVDGHREYIHENTC